MGRIHWVRLGLLIARLLTFRTKLNRNFLVICLTSTSLCKIKFWFQKKKNNKTTNKTAAVSWSISQSAKDVFFKNKTVLLRTSDIFYSCLALLYFAA